MLTSGLFTQLNRSESMVQLLLVRPSRKIWAQRQIKARSLSSNVGIGLLSPPPLSFHNGVATLDINDLKKVTEKCSSYIDLSSVATP